MQRRTNRTSLALATLAVVLSWAWAWEASAAPPTKVDGSTFKRRHSKDSVGSRAPTPRPDRRDFSDQLAGGVGEPAPSVGSFASPREPTPLEAITKHKAKPVDAFPKYQPLTVDEFRARHRRAR